MDSDTKKSVLYGLLEIIFILVLILYFGIKRIQAPNYIFWIIVIINVIFMGYLIFIYNKHSLVFLILFALFIGIIPVFYTFELFYLEKDAIFESQLATLIIKNTRFDPTLGKGFAENYYGYNPLLHITLANLSMVSGKDPFFLAKHVLPIIFRIIILLLVFLIFKEISDNKRIAAIASLIAFIAPSFISISVSRRIMGEIFLLLSFFFLIKFSKERNNIYYFMFILSSIFIVLSDHTSSYMFILLLLAAYVCSFLFKIYLKNKNTHVISRIGVSLLIFVSIFFFWEIFFAPVLLNTEIGYMKEILNFIKDGFSFDSILGKNVYGPSAVHINNAFETFIAYISQFIFVLVAFLGLVYITFNFKNKIRIDNNKLLIFLVLFGIIGYVISGLILRTRLGVVSSALLWLFTLPLALSAGIIISRFISNFRFNRFVICTAFLALLFAGGLIVGFTPGLVNRQFDEDIVLGDERSRDIYLMESAAWLKTHDEFAYLAGDPSVFDIYSGFFEFDVATDYETARVYLGSEDELDFILKSEMLFGNYEHTMTRNSIDYLIINEAVFAYPSFVFGDPLDSAIKEKFDNKKQLSKIYDNNNVQIYKNLS